MVRIRNQVVSWTELLEGRDTAENLLQVGAAHTSVIAFAAGVYFFIENTKIREAVLPEMQDGFF